MCSLVLFFSTACTCSSASTLPWARKRRPRYPSALSLPLFQDIMVQQSIGSACEFDAGDFEHGRNGRKTTHMELADKVKDIHAANTCKVAKFLGSKDIVPLHIQKTVTSSSASGEAGECYFDFRKKRCLYFEEKDNFFKLRYLTKDLFGHYIKGSGYGTEAKINTTRQVVEKHVDICCSDGTFSRAGVTSSPSTDLIVH